MLDDFVHRFVPSKRQDGITLLALHGTGGDENDLIPLAQTVDADAAVLSPRGRVLENGMPRFFRRLAEGVFDQEDLRIRTAELAEFVTAAAARYRFDLSRLIALGYSNGANIAASVLLARPDVLAGAILLRPRVPFEPEAIPDLRGKRVFVSAGRQDSMIPSPLTQRLIDLLRAGGADVTVNWMDTGHGLVRTDIDRAAEWVRTNYAPASQRA
jgi:phospholipase/carboxylesterase